jgi:hypothetical protein
MVALQRSLIKAANAININRSVEDISLVTDALQSSSVQTPQNSRVNCSSSSWKLSLTSHAVLELFSKAAQVLTVTSPPLESRYKSKKTESYQIGPVTQKKNNRILSDRSCDTKGKQ